MKTSYNNNMVSCLRFYLADAYSPFDLIDGIYNELDERFESAGDEFDVWLNDAGEVSGIMVEADGESNHNLKDMLLIVAEHVAANKPESL